MNLFFHILGPFLLLIFLNFKIYMKIKEFEAVTPGALKIHFKQVKLQNLFHQRLYLWSTATQIS
jgi:hypothetical protein